MYSVGMIYFIGGGARCGKSTLAREILKQKPGSSYLSGDSFRQSLKPLLPAFHTSGVNADNPSEYINYYKKHTDEAIEKTIERAESLWPFIVRYVTAMQYESGHDMVVESVDIWPHLIYSLDVPHKAMFLIDTDSAQWQRVTKYLGENDWITSKKLTPEQVEAWASYNAPRIKRVADECVKYGYDYLDIAGGKFEQVQVSALTKLLQ